MTYGLLSSTEAFENNAWNLGGAIVGFLAALFGLNRVYGAPEEAVEGQQQDRNPQGDSDARLLWLGFDDGTPQQNLAVRGRRKVLPS